MASIYTYIVTIGVLLLISMSAAYLFIQQVDSMTKSAQRAALVAAASHTLAGMWSAVEEAKLVQLGGVEFKDIYVGFPYRAEIGFSRASGKPALCVTAFGLRYERPLPEIQGVTYTPSASGGAYVTARAAVTDRGIEISLGIRERTGQFRISQPTECFR
jgi:hypothetical protein